MEPCWTRRAWLTLRARVTAAWSRWPLGTRWTLDTCWTRWTRWALLTLRALCAGFSAPWTCRASLTLRTRRSGWPFGSQCAIGTVSSRLTLYACRSRLTIHTINAIATGLPLETSRSIDSITTISAGRTDLTWRARDALNTFRTRWPNGTGWAYFADHANRTSDTARPSLTDRADRSLGSCRSLGTLLTG